MPTLSRGKRSSGGGSSRRVSSSSSTSRNDTTTERLLLGAQDSNLVEDSEASIGMTMMRRRSEDEDTGTPSKNPKSKKRKQKRKQQQQQGGDEAAAAAGGKMQGYHLRLIYFSHFLSAWSDRMWEFAVALFLIEVRPASMTLVSVYGLIMGLAVFLLGPIVGDAIDRTERLVAVQVSLVSQNLCVALASICVGIVLAHDDMAQHYPVTFWLLVVLILLFGIVSGIGSVASTLAVEKEWMKTLCGEDHALLSRTNAVLRRLDLICKVAAPMVVGFIMTYLGTLVGALFVAGWNVASMFPEFGILRAIYNAFPQLRQEKIMAFPPPNGNENVVRDDGGEGANYSIGNDSGNSDNLPSSSTATAEVTTTKTATATTITTSAATTGTKSVWSQMIGPILTLRNGFGEYRRQPTFYAGLALACLYCTVLSFGSIMTAYAYYRGMSEALLGSVRGIGAVFGVASTFAFPHVVRRLGLVKTGMVSICLQLACLSLSLASIYVGNADAGDCSSSSLSSSSIDSSSSSDDTTTTTSIAASAAAASCLTRRDVELGLLLTGVVTSRMGLWCFDLAVSQLLQDWVPRHRIATINGVQRALQSLLDMFSYTLGIMAASPVNFKYLNAVSFAFCCLATLLYAVFTARQSSALPGSKYGGGTSLLSSGSSEDEKEEEEEESDGLGSDFNGSHAISGQSQEERSTDLLDMLVVEESKLVEQQQAGTEVEIVDSSAYSLE